MSRAQLQILLWTTFNGRLWLEWFSVSAVARETKKKVCQPKNRDESLTTETERINLVKPYG